MFRIYTHFEHIQSSALNSPLLFFAACFPISAPVLLVIESILPLSGEKYYNKQKVSASLHSQSVMFCLAYFEVHSYGKGEEGGVWTSSFLYLVLPVHTPASVLFFNSEIYYKIVRNFFLFLLVPSTFAIPLPVLSSPASRRLKPWSNGAW